MKKNYVIKVFLKNKKIVQIFFITNDIKNKKRSFWISFCFPDLATAGANSTTNAYVSAAADGKSRTSIVYRHV